LQALCAARPGDGIGRHWWRQPTAQDVTSHQHQQYLSSDKNPNGYCNHGPNGMTCPIGVATTDA